MNTIRLNTKIQASYTRWVLFISPDISERITHITHQRQAQASPGITNLYDSARKQTWL